MPRPTFPALMRFRFRLRALEPIALPAYPGSTWRGLLGHGLRHSVCVTGAPVCDGCLLARTCVYSTLFEIPADAPANTPHPFLLDLDPEAPTRLAVGDSYRLGITLIGTAIAQLPYLIHALTQAGTQGVGRARGRFGLEAVDCESRLGAADWNPIYRAGQQGCRVPTALPPQAPPDIPERIGVKLRTPLRLKRAGRFVGAREFDVDDFIRALYRRLGALAACHGLTPDVFMAGYPRPARGSIDMRVDEVRWFDWTRFSSRQQRQMQFGGLLGELELSGDGLAVIWPALWLGQWTHIGKATAFGLGGYRLA
ncbi:CRISPR system precrRNA processing endoribonuclease RAMP protein Cas6 [Marichromatium bheemlicum]|uniref:CRISPR system precrRNA processing endoribonuclease RAMP protein Cas6 n=1 Tax=Marichromatium bheemlicum TaxID=365339 RepID=A0ABX1IEB5_9GAMM|nr:CRISPR system precrRNA processing endoribonuclease RAMP protein Cas6 [Marichromatium bheemlicum]NKN34660.1 CRISPR system precrRNA processing endoribonuclease RAMP protein Cas6 [Marichromatium bheemlicum]